MNSVDIYLREYKEKNKNLRDKGTDIQKEIINCWKEIDNSLKIELKTILNLLDIEVERVYEDLNLAEEFNEKINEVEIELLNILKKAQEIYENSFNDVKERYYKNRTIYQEHLISFNDRYLEKKEEIDEISSKLQNCLDILNELDSTNQKKREEIKGEIIKFKRFTDEMNIQEMEEIYNSLEKSYKTILNKKVVINRILYLEEMKKLSVGIKREISKKIDGISEITSYESLKVFVDTNYIEYFKKIEKYINSDSEIQKNLKKENLISAFESEDRILEIYKKKYQKDILDIKVLSESFINLFYEILKRDYKKIVAVYLKEIIKNERDIFNKIYLQGEMLLKEKNILKADRYYIDNYFEVDSYLIKSQDRIKKSIVDKRVRCIGSVKVGDSLKELEDIVFKNGYILNNEKNSYISYKSRCLLEYKKIVTEKIAEDKKIILIKIRDINKDNASKLKELERIKNIKIKDSYSLELEKINLSISKAKERYLEIYKIIDEKEKFYSSLILDNLDNFNFLKNEVDISLKKEEELCKTYIGYIKEKEKEKEVILKEYRERFNIAIEKGLEDDFLADDLKKYKNYNLTFPNIENIENFIKDRDILKVERSGIFGKIKSKLDLKLKKVINYRGKNYE